jgi:hypothetical protein
MGFPGEEAVEMEVPATMGGTPESCLLEDMEERCICIDCDIESDRAALESRIPRKRARAVAVELDWRDPA